MLPPLVLPWFHENRLGVGADLRDGQDDRTTFAEVCDPSVFDRERGKLPAPAMLPCSDGGTAVIEMPPVPPPDMLLSYDAEFAFILLRADRRLGEPF